MLGLLAELEELVAVAPAGAGQHDLAVTAEAVLEVGVDRDGRNGSRFEWVHVVRITARPKRPLPTIVELSDGDAPLTGCAMTDELGLVHKADLEDRRGMLSPRTMTAIDEALRQVFALH